MAVFRERFRRRALIAAALLLSTPVLVSATLILARDLGAMTKASTDIVRGKVVSIESRWNGDRTLILTDVEIAVTETFKGKPSSQVELELIGGQVEDVALDVVGSPRFTLGEDVVVFATAGKDGRLRLPSLSQEKFRVEQSPDGKTWVSNDQQSFGALLPGEKLTLDTSGRLGWDEFRSGLLKARESEGGER